MMLVNRSHTPNLSVVLFDLTLTYASTLWTTTEERGIVLTSYLI